jgi:diguanylate cyclase (GGDEF)-like protein
VDAGETRYWNDLAADPEIAGLQMVRRMDWRSAIMKAFAAGGTTYIVMFLSQQVPEEPFQADDVSFVDIVTSIFQVHVQQRWQSDRIRFQLEHDPLTGAINRSRFRSLGRMTSEPSGPTAAIAIVDLEAFREVNNAYGSLTGDALLVEVAAALSVVSASGNAELVGRIGGDKFGVWMPALENAAALHERIAAYRRVFEHPFSTGDREGRHFIGLDARIGIAVSTDSSIAFDELMSRADAALYLAKRDRDTMTKYFVAGMELDYRDRKRYAGELLEAIAHEQFSLHVQPHIDLHTMRVVGAEALVRWDHPERGLVMPNDFIPFAEANGLIGQIDAWVLGRAIAIGEFLAEEFAGFRLFFNVSLIDLDTDVLLERLRYVLRSGRGKNLGIELTESGLMRDTRATMQMTTALQSSGMHVAIDDFGTGYSSLAYLKRLPFDVIKIDQSFVRNLPHDPHDLAICEAILSIGARFGKAVLAEGVETLEQLFWLRERGCTLAQGYAICKPIPVDEFLSWTSPFADREWADEPPGESGSGG